MHDTYRIVGIKPNSWSPKSWPRIINDTFRVDFLIGRKIRPRFYHINECLRSGDADNLKVNEI